MTDSDTTTDIGTIPDKLNLGCGWDRRDGYLNVDFQDFHDPDLVADVRDLSALPSGHFVEIVAQDVLEHLERQEILPALEEWARLLKPGGTLVLRVPDLIGVVRVIGRETTYEHHQTMIHGLFGTQAYTGDYHHAGFTELTLRRQLHDAGLRVLDLRRRDEWLFDCVAEKPDQLGEFDPGPLPFLQLVDPPSDPVPTPLAASEAQPTPEAGSIDKAVTAVAKRFPEPVRAAGRKLWRPLRARVVNLRS